MKSQLARITVATALTAVCILAGLRLNNSRSLSRDSGPTASAEPDAAPAARWGPVTQGPRVFVQSGEPTPALTGNPDGRLGQTEGGSETVPRQALASRWSNVPFGEVVSHIQAVTDGPTWAAHDFELWLAAHPDEGPGLVVQALQRADTNEWNLSGLLLHGLAQSESAPARQALVEVLKDAEAYSSTVAIQAVMATGSLGANADSEIEEALLQLVDSPLRDSEYRLSDVVLSALAQLAKDDIVFQQSLVERLTPWLEATATPEATAKAFKALANAAVNQPDLVTRAVQLSQSADETIRLAAAGYLGSLGQTQRAAAEQPRAGS